MLTIKVVVGSFDIPLGECCHTGFAWVAAYEDQRGGQEADKEIVQFPQCQACRLTNGIQWARLVVVWLDSSNVVHHAF